MRLITHADVDIMQTISLAMRLSTREQVAARLRQQYRARPDDLDTCFAYAVCSLILIKHDGNALDLYTHFTHALEALSHVLELEPRHWLARYQRARLPVMIPSDYGSFSEYLTDELRQAADDLHLLIDQQRAVEPQPYFACPYVLLAQYHLGRAEAPPALRLIAQLELPRQPVPLPSLAPILCEPFVQCYHTLRRLGHAAEAARLRELMQALFPYASAVAAIVADGASPQQHPGAQTTP